MDDEVKVIDLPYKGPCEGGPWNGGRIDAVTADAVRIGSLTGCYRWDNGRWLWDPQRPDQGPGKGANRPLM